MISASAKSIPIPHYMHIYIYIIYTHTYPQYILTPYGFHRRSFNPGPTSQCHQHLRHQEAKQREEQLREHQLKMQEDRIHRILRMTIHPWGFYIQKNMENRWFPFKNDL